VVRISTDKKGPCCQGVGIAFRELRIQAFPKLGKEYIMKSRDYRILASVLAALVMVPGAVRWATAQAVNGSGTPNTIPLWTGSGTIGDSSLTQSDNGDQTINANLSVNGSLFLPSTTGPNIGVISIGGLPVLYTVGRNIFVGPSAGNFTTTGSNNTATGDEVLGSDTTGSGNTAMGSHALYSNTTGGGNTATGDFALYSNIEGALNTATGEGTLYFNLKGIANTATGDFALFSNTGGMHNTAIGYMAGANLTIGDNNIDIGANVPGVAGESNTIRIGNVNNNRTFVAGIYGVPTGLPGAAVLVDANGQLGTISSSRRFKDDIQDMGDASSDLMKLRPVTFRYKQAQEDGSHPLQYGLVAEEVAEVNPGLVQFDKDGNPQTVRYHVLPALLLNEVQKEHQKIEDQEKLIQSQQQQLKVQEERLRKLEAILSSRTN
jgi:hypothetical protein